MVRRDGAEARKERIQRIAQSIHADLHKDGEITLSKKTAILQYDLGLTKEKIREYLQILADMDQFTIDESSDRIRKITAQT